MVALTGAVGLGSVSAQKLWKNTAEESEPQTRLVIALASVRLTRVSKAPPIADRVQQRHVY